MTFLRPLGFVVALTLMCPVVGRSAEPTEADAAFRDGLVQLKNKNNEAARTAFEGALRLAPDDAFRLKTYEALVQVYRQLPESEPMVTAQEFIIEHTESRPNRSITSRSLTSFLFQRGLLDKQIASYEARLEKNADDLVAVSVLRSAYNAKRNKPGETEMDERIAKLEAARSAEQAEDFERQAAADPQRAAMHWKDAAVAWRDAGKPDKALAAAEQAEKAGLPNSALLTHFYHRHLGEVYADCGRTAKGIEHLEKAVAATTIQGYQDACQARIQKLRSQNAP